MSDVPCTVPIWKIVVIGGFLAIIDSNTARAVDVPDIRAVISRSLPYIQAGGMEWRKDRKCVSCHRTTFTTWALNRAAERGFSVDDVARSEWNEWSRDWTNHVAIKRRDKAKREPTLLAENDSVAQLLLGRPVSDGEQSDWVDEYRTFLAKAQKADGSWKAGGQLPSQKRPKRETQEVSTMWALVALHDSGAAADVIEPAMVSAEKWLATGTHGQSIEWWTTRLLLETVTGNSEAAIKIRATVVSHQNEDGGWGWLIKDKSDALATGIVLYALAKNGAALTDVEIIMALRFLQRTQGDDGSWPVHGTKKNSADDVTDTATYWGTCWAVIAMAELTETPTNVTIRKLGEVN